MLPVVYGSGVLVGPILRMVVLCGPASGATKTGVFLPHLSTLTGWIIRLAIATGTVCATYRARCLPASQIRVGCDQSRTLALSK